jgi:hypothetical protein
VTAEGGQKDPEDRFEGRRAGKPSAHSAPRHQSLFAECCAQNRSADDDKYVGKRGLNAFPSPPLWSAVFTTLHYNF